MLCVCAPGESVSRSEAGWQAQRRRISHAIRSPKSMVSYTVCSTYAVQSQTVWCGHGMVMQWHAWQWMPSQKQPTTGSVEQDKGPRQAREGGRRLIQLAEAGDHLWSSVLQRTSYRRIPPPPAGYTVPFFFFLNSHVTRWDRIKPTLICSPRIPAA